MNILRVTTVVSLLLSATAVYAESPQYKPEPAMQREVGRIAQGGTPSNPFDIPVAASSQSSEQPKIGEKRMFYRAGKEATELLQAAPVEPEQLPTEAFTDPLSSDNTVGIPSDEILVPDIAPVDEAGIPAEEAPLQEGATENESAPFGAAPSIFSLFGSFGNIMQYAGITVACVGALFLFMFKRKKNALISAPAAVTNSSVENTPVDSDRVKKALAAFHDEAPKQVPDLPAEQVVASAEDTSIDSDGVKKALAAFH